MIITSPTFGPDVYSGPFRASDVRCHAASGVCCGNCLSKGESRGDTAPNRTCIRGLSYPLWPISF